MKYKILSTIHSPKDIKNLDSETLDKLSDEIRMKMIDTVSKNGGHLASNLGVVELTIAMHKVFNSPKDQFVFDVGHQCYTHKLLTGRFSDFDTLRTQDGISGFCRPTESEHDVFYSGHSGTSVSAGLGLAAANLLKNNDSYTVCVIGDGSFTGGMVYEALNNGGRSNSRQIIILNDNKMSISENVGSFAKYLAEIRVKPGYISLKANTEKALSKIPFGTKIATKLYNFKTEIKNALYTQSTFFEDLGYRYIGPIDGHNIEQLCNALESAKKINGPVLMHVITTKGKGYEFAEKSPSVYHGISRFDIDTGEPVLGSGSFSDKFGEYICELAEKDTSICAITAAMKNGTGLDGFSNSFSERFFDVGIAEEHAVTFSSGLAKNGMKPVYAVYSTFIQRCYDQIIHDISLQKLKIIFAIDRAGFVGEDGETHHGIFDVAFLNTIPDIKIYSPCCYRSLRADINNALYADDYSVAIRYPRGKPGDNVSKLVYNTVEFSEYGKSDSVIVTYGRITSEAIEAVDSLNNDGFDISLISLNQIKPIPAEFLDIIIKKKNIWFFEEGQRNGGIGEKVASELLIRGYQGKYRLTAIENTFVEQASTAQLLEKYMFSKNQIIKKISGDLVSDREN